MEAAQRERTVRRSRRLATKRRRARRAPRMSVGEAIGAPLHEDDVTNLAEARAMNSAREAAALLSGHKGKRQTRKGKKHQRAKSQGPKTKKKSGRKEKKKPRARTASPRAKQRSRGRSSSAHVSAHGKRGKVGKANRHRTPFRNSLAAYKATETMFEGETTSDSGDTPPERLQSNSDSPEGKVYSEEEEKYFFVDKRLSLIQTPLEQRSPYEPADRDFINRSSATASEAEATSYEPSFTTSDSDSVFNIEEVASDTPAGGKKKKKGKEKKETPIPNKHQTPKPKKRGKHKRKSAPPKSQPKKWGSKKNKRKQKKEKKRKNQKQRHVHTHRLNCRSVYTKHKIF